MILNISRGHLFQQAVLGKMSGELDSALGVQDEVIRSGWSSSPMVPAILSLYQ